MPCKDQYVMWPHEIAVLVGKGHAFPESRERTVSRELGLFDAFRRHVRYRQVFNQRRDKRERVVKNMLHRECELLIDLMSAQNELHEHYTQQRNARSSAHERLWAGIKRQFLERVSCRMADYLLRIAPWHAGTGSRYEALLSIKNFCARISFGREGYERLLQEALDFAAKKLRIQKFKVRFYAVHRYQETMEHSCTGSCAMRCFETHSTYNLPPQHKSSRSLTQLIDPRYLYTPAHISHLGSEFSMSISFKAP